jgi:hypothetical protein
VPPNVGSAHDLDKVKAAMTLLKSKVEKPRPAKIERADAVAGKSRMLAAGRFAGP